MENLNLDYGINPLEWNIVDGMFAWDEFPKQYYRSIVKHIYSRGFVFSKDPVGLSKDVTYNFVRWLQTEADRDEVREIVTNNSLTGEAINELLELYVEYDSNQYIEESELIYNFIDFIYEENLRDIMKEEFIIKVQESILKATPTYEVDALIEALESL